MLDLEQPISGKVAFPARSLRRHPSLPRLGPNALRTIYWFHVLRVRAQAVSIADLQNKIEPVIPARRKEVQRRWGFYKTGRHRPCSRVVGLAEATFPGSSKPFLSDLWSCLRPDLDARVLAHKLIGQTNAEGDKLLRWMLGSVEPRYRDTHIWVRRYHNLTLMGSLEALAVLVLCARLAGDRGLHELVQWHYLRIFDFLAVHVDHLRHHEVAAALANHFDLVLFEPFKLVPHEVCRGVIDYPDSAENLDRSVRERFMEAGLSTSPTEIALCKLNHFQELYWIR